MNTAPANTISPNRRSSSLRCIFSTIPKMRYNIDDIMPSNKNVNQIMNSNTEFNDSSEADGGYVRRVSHHRMERKSLLSKLGKSLRDIKPFTSTSSSDEEMGYSCDGSHQSGSSYEPTRKSITSSPVKRSSRKVSRRSTMDYSQQLSPSTVTTNDTTGSNNQNVESPVPRPACRKVSRRSTMDYSQRLSSSKVTPNETCNNNNVENIHFISSPVKQQRSSRKVSRRKNMDYSKQLSSLSKVTTTNDTCNKNVENSSVTASPVKQRPSRKVSRRSTMDYLQRLPSLSKMTTNDTYKSDNNNVENMSDSTTYCSELEHNTNNSSNRLINNKKEQQHDNLCPSPSPICSPVKAFRRMSMQYSKRWLSKEDMTSTDFYPDTGSDPSFSITLEGNDTEPPKTTFFKLLNQLNPSSNATSQTRQEKLDKKVLFDKVETLMRDNPRLCQSTYLFNAFIKKSMNNIDDDEDDINEIYPLHFLCSINAPVATIKLCHRLYEPAMLCLRSDIGNPLHYACYYGTSIDIIQYLIMKEPKNLARMNVDGRTPLLMTCLNPNTKYISDILSIVGMLSIHIYKTDNYGNMPLHLLCSRKPTIELIDIIISLLKNKDSCTFAVNKLGQTPLHLAVRCSNIDVTVIKTLIKVQTTTAAPYTTDKKGQTPLHVAIRYYGSQLNDNNNTNNSSHHHYDKNIISYLARKFPQTLTIQDLNGKTPMEIAQQMNLGSRMLKVLTPSS